MRGNNYMGFSPTGDGGGGYGDVGGGEGNGFSGVGGDGCSYISKPPGGDGQSGLRNGNGNGSYESDLRHLKARGRKSTG